MNDQEIESVQIEGFQEDCAKTTQMHLCSVTEGVSAEDKVWYQAGLRFSCTECGACCTGSPGYVWVTDEEIESMADFLDMDPILFQRRFVRIAYGRKALVEMKKNFDCVFLKDKRCSIYPVRPKQCRTFPWWQHNLSTPESWKEAAKYCEGIQVDASGDDSALVSFEEIQRKLNS